VSDDGTRIGFGFQEFGKLPARFDLVTRILIAAPAVDAGMEVPRQTGLPIENWQAWRSPVPPSLNGKTLPLTPYETSRSPAVHPNGDRFVLGTEWRLRAFNAHGTPLLLAPV
jgi:hypothetical protein